MNRLEFDPCIVPLFAVPLYINTIDLEDSWVRHIDDLAYERQRMDNGYITISKQVMDHEALTGLRNQVLAKVVDYTDRILALTQGITWQITTSWANRYIQGDYAHPHFHPNSVINGVLILRSPPGSGQLTFWRNPAYPLITTQQLDLSRYNDRADNPANMQQYSVSHWPGQLILFPAHLSHSVTESTVSSDRLSVAINLWCRGLVGSNPTVEIQL